MNIVNCTPHDVDIRLSNGTWIKYPRSGTVARVESSKQEELDTLANGVPVFEPQRPCGVDLSPSDTSIDGVIVSAMVAEYLGNSASTDFAIKTTLPAGKTVRVFVPDTSPAGAIRNADGQIVAVRGLVEYEEMQVPRSAKRPGSAPKAPNK